jgi:L-lactate dehydrogenase complex protein LldE
MARSLAIKLLDEFESFDYVVLPSGSCTSMVRHHYPQLVADGKGDVRLAERMAALTVKTYDLTDFLVNIAKIKSLPEKKSWSGELTYHDSCSGLRELGIKSQPRALLGQCRDVRLREMTGAEECCGFGGVFSARFGALSAAIAEKKCAGIHATGASAVVGGDLGCLLNIEGKLRRMGDETTQVLHIAEVLAGQGE